MKKTFLLVILSFYWLGLFSQDKNINEFRKICFCTYGLAHPYSILNLDNNWDLLFAFKNGKSLDELDSLSINYSQSQIKILEVWNLIERVDKKYYTTVPVIYSSETKKIREQTKAYAQEIVSLIEDDYSSLILLLEEKHLKDNSFSIFFAFVLDDLVWQHLRKDSLIKRNEITKENPFWDGTMWLIQPEREFSCGTNSIGYENYYISINWNGNLNIELPDYNLLKLMLKDYKENEKIINTEVVENLSKYNFFDEKGELLLPIISGDSTNAFYMQSVKLSTKVADFLKEKIDLGLVIDYYPGITKQQAMLIIYHEIMWDILAIMEKNGELNKPKVFENLENVTEPDLRDIVFICVY